MRALMIAVVMVVACGGDDDPLSDSNHIAGWASASSALGVYAIGYEPIAASDGQNVFQDPACPARTDDGTTLVITGGCTDSGNTRWAGTVTVTRTTATNRSATFDKFGNDRLLGLVETTGSFVVTQMADNVHAYQVEVTQVGGIEKTVSYSGTVQGGYSGPTTWNGSGEIAREGTVINSGSVMTQTTAQVRDSDLCSQGPMSGTTTMTSDEHTVVITYDAAMACDDNARWSRDGKDQGTIEDVGCSAGTNGVGPAILLLGFAMIIRRRLTRCVVRGAPLDPRAHDVSEHRQRDRAGAEHGGVKAFEVEPRSQ
jgi:hypothetical protein